MLEVDFIFTRFYPLDDQVAVTGITGAHVHAEGTRVMGSCVMGPHAMGARVVTFSLQFYFAKITS